LALQPYTAKLAGTLLGEPRNEVVIGRRRYRAEVGASPAFVLETGPDGENRYPMAYALGGKNVYYFLTPRERGRLQVLPISYDVRRKEWFDTTASAVRHFDDAPDEALHWTERPLTFNTSCHGCHVSQLSSNYDLAADAYRTVWNEPGINCETCHGPGGEHVRVCREAPSGRAPADLKIISVARFTHDQVNSLCAPCHAKMIPLSQSFKPGERYFDHFDLACLEDRDFFPDGRDLGENYTFTLWLASPCARSGRLDCMHCHTSSGRYRFKEADANSACLPCHEDRVKQAAAHTHHREESAGNRCVSCHMPTTEFARMRRSDHSMRPPTPAATTRFRSPNACNLCHVDRDSGWADRWVRKWYSRDYQRPVLERAALIEAARRNDWTRLPEMLSYLTRPDREEVFAVSLIRLLADCTSADTTPVLVKALEDASPLARSAAASTLGTRLSAEAVAALLTAVRDDYLLVRVRAAAALAGAPPEMIPAAARPSVDGAEGEFESAMRARPDDATSRFNLANFYFAQGAGARAAQEFETSLRLQPDNLPALVNAALAYNQLGRNDQAEAFLRRALALRPADAAANLNLGLLLGEQGRKEEAISLLRQALKSDPTSAVAAYNLGILLFPDHGAEALEWFRRAAALQPNEPKYRYTLAFYLRQSGRVEQAVGVLRPLVERGVTDPAVYELLGAMFEESGRAGEAAAVYGRAAEIEQFPADLRLRFRLKSRNPSGGG
jgi:tetratricopeptide (TPR) repeat protein